MLGQYQLLSIVSGRYPRFYNEAADTGKTITFRNFKTGKVVMLQFTAVGVGILWYLSLKGCLRLV